MVYFIILLVLVILLIPQIYYRKSNKLLQNDGVELTCDLEFINEVAKGDDLLDFGNERDFYELPNLERVKIKSYDGFILDGTYFPVEDSNPFSPPITTSSSPAIKNISRSGFLNL